MVQIMNTNAIVYRPVLYSDIDALYEFSSKYIGIGNAGAFQCGKEKLEEVIEASVETFSRDVKEPGFDDVYVFVLVDEESGQVLGLYKINAWANKGKPFYTYKIVDREVGFSKKKIIKTLYLSDEYTKSTMPGSQILQPNFRNTIQGMLILCGHNLYYRQFKERFCEIISGEIRGVYEGNCAVFWKYFLQHYLGDLSYKDYLKIIQEGREEEILNELPTGPIPMPIIPGKAASVIGAVNCQSKGALRINEREGITSRGHIAYSTAAPFIEGFIEDLRSVKNAILTTTESLFQTMKSKHRFIISNSKPNLEFRVCIGQMSNKNISAATLKNLNVESGEAVCVLP